MRDRNEVVKLAESWIGLNEKDGSFRKIIDIWNDYSKKTRNVKMKYTWAWCACTWSALAIKLGYTDIMPIEISCGNLIEQAKKMGIWVENDAYFPKPGDAVLYDWDDNGKGDNVGWPDHVGVVTYVNKNSGYFVVIEGNYKNSVKKRTVSVNGRYIRGFICPKYDSDAMYPTKKPNKKKSDSEIAHEVIAGQWGNGAERKERLEKAGYNYEHIQANVETILGEGLSVPTDNDQEQPVKKKVIATTKAKLRDERYAGIYKATALLRLRNDAGTNKKILTKIPVNTKVHCYGYYSYSDKVRWPLVQVTLDGISFTGFCSEEYLKRV